MPGCQHPHSPRIHPDVRLYAVGEVEKIGAAILPAYLLTQCRIIRRMNNPKPLPILTHAEILRFWSLVDIRGPEECWPWLGPRTTARYGAVYGVWWCHGNWRPHRIAYELGHNNRQNEHRIPDGLTIDHVKARGCTLKLCCNYAHLEPVTQTENVGRYYRDTPGASPTYCLCGKPRRLNGRDRRCGDCFNAYFREYNAKNREKIHAIANTSYERVGRQTRKRRLEQLSKTSAAILETSRHAE